MMGMLQELQNKIEETKRNLDFIVVQGEAGGITVDATASRKIKSISIPADVRENADAEELEDLLVIALNKALALAENTWEEEMKKAAGGLLPPGLAGF